MPRKKTKSKKTVRKKKKPEKSVNAFEDIGSFSQSFKPAIRVRAVKPRPSARMKMVLGGLLLFVILFVFSSILYIGSTANFYVNLFFLLSLVFGGIAIAFLIILLVLVFLKILER